MTDNLTSNKHITRLWVDYCAAAGDGPGYEEVEKIKDFARREIERLETENQALRNLANNLRPGPISEALAGNMADEYANAGMAVQVASRKIIDDAYEKRPRYTYQDGVVNNWQPLYATPRIDRADVPPSDARLALSIADEHFGYPARGNAVDVTCMCSYCQYARARGPVTKVSAPSCPVCFAEPDEAHALSCRYVLTDETGAAL